MPGLDSSAQTSEIDAILREMDAIIEDAQLRGDPLGFFAAMYRGVTLRVRDGIHSGRFDDGPRMDRFDAHFARRYLDALAAWRTGAALTRSWRLVFEASVTHELTIIQHLLLGINAHINLDLAIVTAEFNAPTMARDFNTINEIIGAMTEDVQRVINEFSPGFHLIDRSLFSVDEAMANFSLKRARRDAWYHAQLLTNRDEEERERDYVYLDRRTAFLARLIRRPDGVSGHIFKLAKILESDDNRAILQALATLP